jgi:hypothetical protein
MIGRAGVALADLQGHRAESNATTSAATATYNSGESSPPQFEHSTVIRLFGTLARRSDRPWGTKVIASGGVVVYLVGRKTRKNRLRRK